MNRILFLIIALFLYGCSSSDAARGQMTIKIVESKDKKETIVDCKCPKSTDSTAISTIGGVCGNLISSLWD